MSEDDRELWNSANTDTPVETPQEEAPQAEEAGPVRDEKGRFAPKAEEPKAEEKPLVTEQKPPEDRQEESQGIPSWRLKEEADARRAAEERAAQSARELDALSRRLAEIEKQNKPQDQVPDIFENPNAFVEHYNQKAIDPVRSEVEKLREFYSQRDAIREHGAEKVQQAFSALDQAAKSGDPEAVATVSRVKQSMDPYGDIVKWHRKQTIFSTIGDDPEAFVERQLEERMKDPAYQAKLLERLRGQAQTRPPVTQLPPSLNRTPSAAPADDDGEDASDAGLLKTALRR